MPTYLYAITKSDHPLHLDTLKGVGEPAVPLRSVAFKTLAAVVSDAPEGLRAKRRDVLAHQGVLEQLLTEGAALPMRFGVVGPSDDAVLAALREQHDPYARRLEELDCCIEYNLKASRDEDDLLREILSGSERIRELNELTRNGSAAHEDRMALGELIAGEVSAREEEANRALTSRLAASALRVSPADPPKGSFLNVSFLLKRDDAPAFSEAVHGEAERLGDAYHLRLNGPLPPYSFV
ncbi:GvpL/GvpF family gas vesicle protein [Streptomyces sp900116325]|uniref:GvpL/GvpF family gas vesicle protein n=1 Tax=Streptomyces sp. 900116325 TaxID=3154295 RepID=UPI00332EC8C3